MRDVWRWWKVRKAQLKTLLVLGLVLLWLILNICQSERYFRSLIQTQQQSIKNLEVITRFQLDQLSEVLEAHLAQQDLDAAALRCDFLDFRFMIGQLIEQPACPAVR